MRAGAFGIALASLCFLLTACGGGGGGGSPALVPTGTAATNAPSSAPSVSTSPYPRTDGDVYVYSGQLQQTFQSFPEVVPLGTPSPEPTSVTTENVTQNISVKSNQTFNGGTGLYNLHSAETDAITTGLKTTTSTTDTYEAIAQSGTSSQLLDYGSQFADEAGDTTTTMYSPQAILDELPEMPGAQWSNGPGATIDEALAGNSSGSAITSVRTVNSDGSYSENTTYPPNYSAPGYTGVGQIQENTDGSGTFSFVANGGAIAITYSKPEPQPTGAPLITVNEYLGLNTTVKPYATFQLPTWYGNAPALYNESDLDEGTVTVPAACGLAKTFPSQATAIAQTISRTDTILGYTEQQTTTNYVAAGYGNLCTISKDTQTFYYDFNGDQPFVYTQAPPLQITTVAETLALQPGSVVGGTPMKVAVGTALQASFRRAVSNVRQTRTMQLVRAAQSLRAKGGTL
jgi:hypothetical protein